MGVPHGRRRWRDQGPEARRRAAAAALAGFAVGTGVYGLAVPWFIHRGWARWDPASRLDGVRRALLEGGPPVLLVLAVVCAVVAARADRSGWDEPAARLAALGACMAGAGVAWFGWGLIDHYALAQWRFGGSAIAAVGETAFHGAGVVVAALGWTTAVVADVPVRRASRG